MIEKTVAFLRDVLNRMRLKTGRGRLDVFSDRLLKASSQPTLLGALEQLLRSVDASVDDLDCIVFSNMMQVIASEEASGILRWFREQPKIVTMLAAVDPRDTAFSECISAVKLPKFGDSTSVASIRTPYAVKLEAICESPLAHGADAKAGNATLFRRMHVLTASNDVLHLPFYSGNAVRGQMRDLLADHLLSSINISLSDWKSKIALWFFYALYSGGALEERSDATKALKRQLGDNGAIRADGIREFRTKLPMISLLGCALGNRVLPGRIQVADLRPKCVEWGTGDAAISDLLSWQYMTRREDDIGHSDNHSMIVDVETLRPGTILEGGVDLDHAISSLEKSVLGCSLGLLRSRAMLGAENRRGFGKVRISFDGADNCEFYEQWLNTERAELIEYLFDIGALLG